MKDRISKFKTVTCIVIAYNEEETIALAITEVIQELQRFNFENIEVIVVDDGSTDKTGEIAHEVAQKNKEVRIIRHEKNKGPGSGIKTGILNAKNDLICFHAADRQLDFAEVCSFIPVLDEYDMLIGERKDRPGYTLARLAVSKISIFLAKSMFGLKYRDYYFLYLYRKSVFLGMKLDSEGVFVVTEILVKALKKGLKVGEISVGCYPRKFGKATCGKPKIVLKTFWELIRFWFKQNFLNQ